MIFGTAFGNLLSRLRRRAASRLAPDGLRSGVGARRISFNINHNVRVKLTPHGLDILKQQHDELARIVPSLGAFQPPKADAEGWSKWQLWCLMRELGAHCVMGCPVPFETEIEIEALP